MSITIEPPELTLFRRNLDNAVRFEQLTRFDWRRQTDAVQQAFIVAAIFTDHPEAVFVDGHINDHVKRAALDSGSSIKAFFNRRFHDIGFKYRRVLFYDTKQGRGMGVRKGSGRDKLHFHGIFVMAPGWARAGLKRELAKVFGEAPSLGQRQFHCSAPQPQKHFTHNGVQVSGPVGKALYSIAHAGATYRNLELNDEGKRSRRAPKARGSYNKKSKGLARGVPSNFTSEVVFCDTESKRAGKRYFDMWVRAERAIRQRAKSTSPSQEEQMPSARASARRPAL